VEVELHLKEELVEQVQHLQLIQHLPVELVVEVVGVMELQEQVE
tara:strand:+ start:416 stop:547 length:132 start_codon:yes stop_codon:yes gene_type:complete